MVSASNGLIAPFNALGRRIRIAEGRSAAVRESGATSESAAARRLGLNGVPAFVDGGAYGAADPSCSVERRGLRVPQVGPARRVPPKERRAAPVGSLHRRARRGRRARSAPRSRGRRGRGTRRRGGVATLLAQPGRGGVAQRVGGDVLLDPGSRRGAPDDVGEDRLLQASAGEPAEDGHSLVIWEHRRSVRMRAGAAEGPRSVPERVVRAGQGTSYGRQVPDMSSDTNRLRGRWRVASGSRRTVSGSSSQYGRVASGDRNRRPLIRRPGIRPITLSVFEGGAARSRHSRQATPGDRAERFHGDRSHARRGVSLTSRRRIESVEKAPFPGLFP